MTFPLLLSPVPSEWYHKYVNFLLTPLVSFTQLCSAITVAFTRRGGPDRAEAELRKMKMKEGESVDTYLYDVVRLCKLVDASMKESRKIHYIIRGLLPVLFHQIMAKDFKTVTELRQHLHRLEDARHTFGEDSPYFQMIDQSSKKTNQLSQEMQELKTLMTNFNTTVAGRSQSPTSLNPPAFRPNASATSTDQAYTSSNRSSDGKPMCYNCTQTGHISRYCRNEPYCVICQISGDHTYSTCPRRRHNQISGNAEQRMFITTPLVPCPTATVKAANDQPMTVLGKCSTTLSIATKGFLHCFYVLEKPPYDVILGTDFLSKFSAVISYPTESIQLNSEKFNSTLKLSLRRHPTKNTEPYHCAYSPEINPTSTCRISYSSPYITLHVLATAESTDDVDFISIGDMEDDSSIPAKKSELTDEQINSHNINPALCEEDKAKLISLLQEFSDAFAWSTTEIKTCPNYSFTIDTGNEAPVHMSPYRHSMSERLEIQLQIQELLIC
ncbi:unnamed protein product [Orchesella dallaii]|uniref:CCHC-type domain-containing protein n=1 Tax=Orchesella dallaii TaxID=48710 RepID=A0ABP1SAW3_9HEXA